MEEERFYRLEKIALLEVLVSTLCPHVSLSREVGLETEGISGFFSISEELSLMCRSGPESKPTNH